MVIETLLIHFISENAREKIMLKELVQPDYVMQLLLGDFSNLILQKEEVQKMKLPSTDIIIWLVCAKNCSITSEVSIIQLSVQDKSTMNCSHCSLPTPFLVFPYFNIFSGTCYRDGKLTNSPGIWEKHTTYSLDGFVDYFQSLISK